MNHNTPDVSKICSKQTCRWKFESTRHACNAGPPVLSALSTPAVVCEHTCVGATVTSFPLRQARHFPMPSSSYRKIALGQDCNVTRLVSCRHVEKATELRHQVKVVELKLVDSPEGLHRTKAYT